VGPWIFFCRVPSLRHHLVSSDSSSSPAACLVYRQAACCNGFQGLIFRQGHPGRALLLRERTIRRLFFLFLEPPDLPLRARFLIILSVPLSWGRRPLRPLGRMNSSPPLFRDCASWLRRAAHPPKASGFFFFWFPILADRHFLRKRGAFLAGHLLLLLRCCFLFFFSLLFFKGAPSWHFASLFFQQPGGHLPPVFRCDSIFSVFL